MPQYGACRVRHVVFCFADSPAFARALRDTDEELLLPGGASVGDGEWVLAIFEIGRQRVSTATAARGLHRGTGAGAVLVFERRDWERLVRFSEVDTPPRPLRSNDRRRRGKADPLAHPPKARVLLIDGDRDILDVVASVLEAVGLTVEAVTSAEDALERMAAASHDVLVLDWNLPGMSGIELCRVIRKDPALSKLPVLFLTAQVSPHDVVDAFASGADDYVVKPFRAPELGARIFSLLRRARTAIASI
jgi:two-component system phosphate regulon response regulator PhoB